MDVIDQTVGGYAAGEGFHDDVPIREVSASKNGLIDEGPPRHKSDLDTLNSEPRNEQTTRRSCWMRRLGISSGGLWRRVRGEFGGSVLKLWSFF